MATSFGQGEPSALLGYADGVVEALEWHRKNATYPILCVDNLKLVFPGLAAGQWQELAIHDFNQLLIIINYTGLTLIDYIAVTSSSPLPPHVLPHNLQKPAAAVWAASTGERRVLQREYEEE